MGHEEYVFRAYRWAWDADLPSSTKLVLLALCDHVNRDDTSCHPSWVGIENMTGLGRRTVARAVSHLVESGLISTDPRPGKTNRYLLNLPADPCHGGTGRGATVARVEADPCHGGTGTRATVAPKDIYKNKLITRGGVILRESRAIADDWRPEDATLERIRNAGLPPPSPEMILQFIAHYQAKGEQATNWDALFVTWCVRELRFSAATPAPRTARTGGTKPTTFGEGDWVARGRSVGIDARPGETMEAFAARVRAAEGRALS